MPFRYLMFTGTLLSTALLATNASAQTQTGADRPVDVHEIVVTAQHREQSARDVSIAITAFTDDDIKTRAIVSSVDVARVTPGAFVSSSGGGQFAQFSIRGVTQNDINDFVEGPVAVYVDDTYVPSLQGQSFGLFDLERVEVLKGPQGTLFGRNATGGLVHFVVAKPTDVTKGFVNLTYGRFNKKKVEAAIGGPISETLQYRASVYWDKHSPWMRNIYPGNMDPYAFGTQPITARCCDDAGNEDTLAGRLQLQWLATDRLTIRLSGSAARSKLSTAPYNQVATVPIVNAAGGVVGGIYASPTETRAAIGPDGNNFAGIPGSPPMRAPGADWFGYLAPPGKKRQFGSDYSNKDAERVKAYDVSLHMNYDFDGASLTSISSYKKLTKHFGLDADASPLNYLNVWFDADTESFSQELRVAGSTEDLTWTAGGYFLHINTDSAQAYLAPAHSLFGAIVGFPDTGIALGNVNSLRTTSVSLFGQIEYNFAPKFTLVLGGRIIRERQNFKVYSGAFPVNNIYELDTSVSLFSPLRGYQNKRSDSLWAGKAQLEFRPDSKTLIYAGINRGVKAGNYNSQLPDGSPPLPLDAVAYRPEVLISYEGGLKRSFPEIGAFLALSGFYYDYQKYQAFLFSNASGYTVNRDSRTYGVEFEASISPIEGLRLTADGSYVNAKVKNLQIAEGVVRDVRPGFTPRYQLGGSINYKIPASIFGGHISTNFNGHYNSSFFSNIRNFDSQKIKGHTIFNGSITWESEENGLSVAAMVENIFDKRYAVTSLDLSTLCGCSEIAYGKPSWWSIRVGYKF